MNAQSARRQIRKCQELEKRGEEFMRCPCHSVIYCQRGCQVDDWKEHKKVCSYYAEKKKPSKAKLIHPPQLQLPPDQSSEVAS